MIKKTILLGLVFLVLLSSAFAGNLNESFVYLSFDDGTGWSGGNPTDLRGNMTATSYNSPRQNTTAILGKALDLDGTSEYVNLTFDSAVGDTSEFSLSFWIYQRNSGVTCNPIGNLPAAQGDKINLHWPNANGNWYWDFGSTSSNRISGSYTYGTGNWKHIVVTADLNDLVLYVNGSVVSNTSLSQSVDTDVFPWLIGQYGASSYCNAIIDEWNTYLFPITQNQVNQLYNSGAGFNPYATVVPDFFEVTATDGVNGTAILNFTIQVNNTNYTTTNGTVATDIATASDAVLDVDIFWANQSERLYYNRTYASHNTNTTLAAQLYVRPIIKANTWNMTSDGGCTVWNTNQSTNCNTTDGTPTVTLTTNYAANCSMSTSNYATYNSSRICGTTGATSQICTLYDADKLDFGTDDLYVQCENVNSNQDLSSSLAINMTAGGGGGSGLIACIETVGAGCAAVITNNCAAIIS